MERIEMKEKSGDLFESDAGVIVIPIHHSIDVGKNLVMSWGVMYQAVQIYPELPKLLGAAVYNSKGKFSVMVQTHNGQLIAGFITKKIWCDTNPSTILTLTQSAEDLVEIIDTKFEEPESVTIALPRVGCGGGKLDWVFVKSYLEDILDDRFTVYHREVEENVIHTPENIKKCPVCKTNMQIVEYPKNTKSVWAGQDVYLCFRCGHSEDKYENEIPEWHPDEL